MRRTLTIILAVLTALSLGASSVMANQATPATGGTGGLNAAVTWLIGQQDESGGFAGFNGEPDVAVTIDAVIALATAELQGIDTGSAIEDATTFLNAGDHSLVYAQTGTGQAAKLVLGTAAYGGNPHDIAHLDPLVLVDHGFQPDTGLYGEGIYNHALSLIALGASGEEIPQAAIETLETTQTPEGGWSFDGTADEGAADSNTTALVIMALVATGNGDSPLIADGLAYLQTTLVDSTGATFQPGDGALADANSTALVLQAVVAAGDDAASGTWGNLPAALAAFQNDSGAFHYNATDTSDNLYSTVQAIPALGGYALPVVLSADWPPVPTASTPVGTSSTPLRSAA